ncbi:hypothetical protein C5167_004029 [Papaver somniferum]|nr:hypothetical protein C5167_004029 [Papaver somniferum]
MGRVSRKKESLVEDLNNGSVELPCWNIEPCRGLEEEEIQEVMEFSRILDNQGILAADDKWEWISNSRAGIVWTHPTYVLEFP